MIPIFLKDAKKPELLGYYVGGSAYNGPLTLCDTPKVSGAFSPDDAHKTISTYTIHPRKVFKIIHNIVGKNSEIAISGYETDLDIWEEIFDKEDIIPAEDIEVNDFGIWRSKVSDKLVERYLVPYIEYEAPKLEPWTSEGRSGRSLALATVVQLHGYRPAAASRRPGKTQAFFRACA